MPPNVGAFSGNPQTEWLDEAGPDRRMRLLADFAYVDPEGRRWAAPAGAVLNGASIPAALWSMVGSPYTGDYRRASIVHDVACGDPGVSRREADRMFYFACLAGGCAERQARLVYAGVRIGAWLPDVRLWEEYAARTVLAADAVQPTLAEESIRTTFREIAADVNARGDTLRFAELDRLVERHLEAKTRQ